MVCVKQRVLALGFVLAIVGCGSGEPVATPEQKQLYEESTKQQIDRQKQMQMDMKKSGYGKGMGS